MKNINAIILGSPVKYPGKIAVMREIDQQGSVSLKLKNKVEDKTGKVITVAYRTVNGKEELCGKVFELDDNCSILREMVYGKVLDAQAICHVATAYTVEVAI